MLIDIHTHTVPLSDDSDMAPSELIERARAVGLDGVCLTEHDAFWKHDDVEALGRRHGFLVLPGAELNTEEEHLLVFGLEKWVIGMSRADFVMELVDRAGGATVVAHPFRRKILKNGDPDNNRYNREMDRACKNPLFRAADAIEVLNARGDDRQNAFSQELAQRLDKPGVGGSDAHEPGEIGFVATEFERRITDLDEFIAELKAGRCRAVSLGA
jgi:predicted metal-dependent phosphoesterase TrpH